MLRWRQQVSLKRLYPTCGKYRAEIHIPRLVHLLKLVHVSVLMTRLTHFGLWGCAVARVGSQRSLTRGPVLSQAVRVRFVVFKVALR